MPFPPVSLVSVVINTLNRREHLERTLVSLADQIYRPFEVIVVNGPSTDGTSEMLRRYSKRARLARCPQANLAVSRNLGVEMAAGDIVAFTDDDATPEPGWLEKIVREYEDPAVAAVGGPVFDVPLNRVEWKICTSTRLGDVNTDSSPRLASYNTPGSDPFPYLAGCNMSFRRSALQRVGGFNAMLEFGYDDVDVGRILNDAGYVIRYSPTALVRHHRAPSAVRDHLQRVTDPYTWVYCRAVFALQTASSSESWDEIDQHILRWSSDWHAVGEAWRADGVMSLHDCQTFARRASRGAEDGRAAGRLPRPFCHVGHPRHHEFRTYV